MHYYAHGKLLLSGEYLVLKGAQALAIPTRYGQSLSFYPQGKNLYWQSFDHEKKLWFEATFSSHLEVIKTNNPETAEFLKSILQKASNLKGKNIPFGKIEMQLEFPQNWGLGSSSTLTHLVAQWLEVDPYELFFATQNGSGYDIACATTNAPLIYSLIDKVPSTKSVTLSSVFENAFFVHLNKKQNSRPAVTNFLKKELAPNLISEISAISLKMAAAQSVDQLKTLIDQHEEIMSHVLQTATVKDSLFSDFDGSIKSLGAWGGDFVMAIGTNTEEYFKNKNFKTVIPFGEMILS